MCDLRHATHRADPQTPHLQGYHCHCDRSQPSPLASPQGWHWGGLGVKRCPRPLPPLQQSGLSLWISDQLHPLENVSPMLAVFTITCVVIFFTEFASNTATIIIFLPVMSELVRALLGMRGRQGGAPFPQPPRSETSPLLAGSPLGSSRSQCSLAKCVNVAEPRFKKNTVGLFSFKKNA